MAGCALSLSIHILALIGVYSKSILNFATSLLVGVLPVFFLAVLAQERLLFKFTFRDRMFRMFNPRFAHKVTSRLLLGQAPKWLRVVLITLFVNAFAQFALFAYQTFPSGSLGQSAELRMLARMLPCSMLLPRRYWHLTPELNALWAQTNCSL